MKKAASRSHVQALEIVGQHPRHHDAVFQGEAGPRRPLGAIAQHQPAAVGAAGEVAGVKVQIQVLRRGDPVAGEQEARMAEDQLGREQPALQKLLGTVEIGQDRVQ